MHRFTTIISTTAVAFVVAVLAATSVSAQNPGGSAEARRLRNPVPSTPASITAGAAAYKKYCAFCHGATARGDGPLAPKGTMPANLADAEWDRGSTDGEIFTVIMAGAGPTFEMKGFKGRIPDQDAWHIVNFLRSLAPRTTTPAR
jgi:mono/diheme cytochrome c family protein